MKKTTKILLVLAAVVAMTIGAVSTVMAADYPEIAKWVEADKGVWTAFTADDKEIKDTWAVDPASGFWYYFDKFGDMEVNEFILGDDGWYYVDKNGHMSTGWIKFTDADDDCAVVDVVDRITTDRVLDGDENNAYGEEVWVYFNENGVAVEDAWLQDLQYSAGLWYYFDNIIMISNDYSFKVDGKIYGFHKDGYEYFGWEEVVYDKINDQAGPLDASFYGKKLGWVHYDEKTGEMTEAGWEKLDNDTWYYFQAVNTGDRFERIGSLDRGATVALANTYLVDSDNERYYFGADCKLVKGQTYLGNISKTPADYMKSANETDKILNPTTADVKQTFFFDAANGNQKFKDQGGNYYLPNGGTTIYAIAAENEYTNKTTVIDFSNQIAEAGLPGKMVKADYGVILKDGSNYFYYDKDGNIVKDDVVTVKGLTFAIAGDGKIVKDNGATTKVGSRKYSLSDVNGTLLVNGVAVAYGANTKTTSNFIVEVVADASVSNDLKASIANAIENKYAIGETVKYSMISKYKTVQFKGITVDLYDGDTKLAEIVADDEVAYAGGKTSVNAINGYTFSFKMPDVDGVIEDLEELSNGEFEIEDKLIVKVNVKTVPQYMVKYNGVEKGYYVVGEAVTIDDGNANTIITPDSAMDVFDSSEVVATGVAVANVAYATNGAADAEDLVVYRNKLAFTMPATNVAIEATEVNAYKVTIATNEAIEALPFEGMFVPGETVTFTSIDTTNKPNVAFDAIVYTSDKTKNVFETLPTATTTGANSFDMIDKNVTVGVKATADALTGNLTVTGAAITEIKVGTATADAISNPIEATKDVVITLDVATVSAVTVVRTTDLGTEVIFDGTVTVGVNAAGKVTVAFKMPGNDIEVKVTP